MVAKSDICTFSNDVLLNLTFFDKIKLAIATVTVVPLRLLVLTILFSILWIVGIISVAGRTEEDCKKPLGGWRSIVRRMASFFGRAVFFSAGFHWVKQCGEMDKDVKMLIFAPHMSYFDALIFVYMNYPSPIARAGADGVPLFGNLVKLTQALIVDREDSASRSDVIKKVLDRVNSPHQWPKMGIFSEGTCTNGKSLVKFKPGAFLPGIPVQPVCFRYRFSHDTVTWSWKGPSPFVLLWLTLCQFNTGFEVHYLPVYYPSDEEKQNAELYADNVRVVMAEYLQIPLSEYSFEDCRVISRAEKCGLPWETGKIKVLDLKKKLGVSLDRIFDTVPLYAKIANLKTGLAHMDTFNEYMQIDTQKTLEKFYDLFDKKEKGYFTLPEFIETYFNVIQKELDSKSEFLNNLLNDIDLYENGCKKINVEKLNKVLSQLFNDNFKNLDIIKTLSDYFHLDSDNHHHHNHHHNQKSKHDHHHNKNNSQTHQNNNANNLNNNNSNHVLNKNDLKHFLMKNYPLHIYYAQILTAKNSVN